MKLLLGPPQLQKELEFTIFEKIAGLPTVHKRISRANKIGLFLSGGPDSAALLCLIIVELRQAGMLDTTPIHCFIIDKDEGQVIYALNVIAEVERIYNIKIAYNVMCNIPDVNFPSRLGSAIYKRITEENPNTVMYQGINNPPTSNIKIFIDNVPRSYGHDEYINSGNNLMCFPFLNMHKPQILDIFYKLNCESVAKYTQSCYTMSKGVCGKCFSCEERAWGFSLLGIKDPIEKL